MDPSADKKWYLKEPRSMSKDHVDSLKNQERIYKQIEDKPGYNDHFCETEKKEPYSLKVRVLGNDLDSYLTAHSTNYFIHHHLMQTASSIMDAVIWLHDQNIVHGDIKTENIVIVQDDDPPTARLIDLEAAIHKDSPDRITNTILTPGFIPPELITKINKRQQITWNDIFWYDLWALGIVLLLMTTYHDRQLFNQYSMLQTPDPSGSDHHKFKQVADKANKLLTQTFGREYDLNLLDIDPKKRRLVKRTHPINTLIPWLIGLMM